MDKIFIECAFTQNELQKLISKNGKYAAIDSCDTSHLTQTCANLSSKASHSNQTNTNICNNLTHSNLRDTMNMSETNPQSCFMNHQNSTPYHLDRVSLSYHRVYNGIVPLVNEIIDIVEIFDLKYMRGESNDSYWMDYYGILFERFILILPLY